MDILENPQKYRSIDPQEMYRSILKFPEQILEAIEIVRSSDVDDIDSKSIDNILLLGMGGSAIGGDLVRAFSESELKIPFMVNRTYDIPAFVGKNTLLLVSSYSGNTEETLSAMSQAIEKTNNIICISTNGKLEKICQDNGYPLVKLPKGFQPRAALGYSFTAVLLLLSELGFIRDRQNQLKEASKKLIKKFDHLKREVERKRNHAKAIAHVLHNKLPIIYTSSKVWNSVGLRIRGQIEENAKMLAYSNEFPEMNHNEIVGWNKIEFLKDRIVPIFIMDEDIHRKVKFRMNFTKEIFEKMGIESITIEDDSDTLIERIMSIIQIGDFISYYLAILNQVDPMPVRIIEHLKQQLELFND
ncbi:MAG: bifunctional phosphoglucose/phosphomannose isomerase [Candidatus Zixiibacteriota bacterium]